LADFAPFVVKNPHIILVSTRPRLPNGKKADGKRVYILLARSKEQCIERVQAICQQNRPHEYCPLTVAELFYEWHHSILHRVKESTAANYTMKAEKRILPAFGDKPVSNVTANLIYVARLRRKQNSAIIPQLPARFQK